MNTRILTSVTAAMLFAALMTPVSLDAQDDTTQVNKPKHHHYKVVDIGLGGPQSAVFEFFHTLTSRGTLVGMAETSTPDPNYPNFTPFIGFGNPDPFIQHAFLWQDGDLTDLGALVNSSQVDAVNGKGVAAGVSENGLIDPLTGLLAIHAVVWQTGQIIDLGTLGGGYESTANDINNRGQVVGASQNTIPDPFGYGGVQLRAFLWQNRAMQDLGTLGAGNDAVASLTNERGQVVGWSYTNSTPNPSTGIPTQDPYLWANGTMLDLGSLGGTVGAPNALNNRGEVAGLSNLVGDTTTHPFLWTKAEGMKDLGTFGGTFGEATWINDAGGVIGGATLSGDQVIHAFLWKDGVKTDLGTLEGDPSSFAFGLNSKGQVVGNSGSANGTRGFLWENGKMFDLNTLVSPASKLNLNFPTIINDRGEIAGQAQLPNGDIHAFLLIPCDGDHSGERECEEETAATTTPRNIPADVSLTRMNTPQGSLTPGEIVARMRSRFGRNRPFAAFPRK
jgi:probable HAF family extracellular repeat protein